MLAISAVTGQGIPQLIQRNHRVTEGAANEHRLDEPLSRCRSRRRPHRRRASDPCCGSWRTWETPGSSGAASIETGRLAESIALPLDDSPAWAAAWEKWNRSRPERHRAGPSRRSIRRWPNGCNRSWTGRATPMPRWFRSAADVPVRHELIEPETAGADRALAVAAAIGLAPAGRPGRRDLVRDSHHDRANLQARNLARRRDCARALRERPRLAPSNRSVAAGRAASSTAALGSIDASGRRSGRLLGHRRRGARAPAIDKRPTWETTHG